MPRRPRVFVEGGINHVYNRIAGGEPVFSDSEEAKESADEFIEHCAAVLDVDVADLEGGSRQRNTVEARRLIVTLGRDRWGQSTKDLASVLQKSPDTVTYIQREGVKERLDDEAFSRRCEDLDTIVVGGDRF